MSNQTKLQKIAALVNPNTTTVSCTINGQTYTYRVTQQLAQEIQEHLDIAKAENEKSGGEAFINVVCEHSRSEFTQRRCIAVHEEAQIDPDADINYLWCVALSKNNARIEAEAIDKKLAEGLGQRQRRSYKQTALAEYGVTRVEDLLIEQQ